MVGLAIVCLAPRTTLTKVPIVWGGSQVKYLTNHITTAASVSAMSCVLLHYKILRDGMTFANLGTKSGRTSGPPSRVKSLLYLP